MSKNRFFHQSNRVIVTIYINGMLKKSAFIFHVTL